MLLNFKRVILQTQAEVMTVMYPIVHIDRSGNESCSSSDDLPLSELLRPQTEQKQSHANRHSSSTKSDKDKSGEDIKLDWRPMILLNRLHVSLLMKAKKDRIMCLSRLQMSPQRTSPRSRGKSSRQQLRNRQKMTARHPEIITPQARIQVLT